MDTSEVYRRQLEVAKRDFPDVVERAQVVTSESGVPLKLRLRVTDGSVLDCFCSISGKYSYHWDRRAINGSLYRHDNAPHGRWHNVRTFPKHLHNGSEDPKDVRESTISDDPVVAIRQFLGFVRDRLAQMGRERSS